MKKRNSILIGVIAILLCIVGGVVGATFSRYTSQATATPTAQVAKWKVSVGGTDISSGTPQSFNSVITWEKNTNVESGYFAPGMTGTTTFIINAAETQVPVDYEVAINQASISNYPQISIKSVTAMASGSEAKPLTGVGPYKGGIELEDISKPVTITVTLEWEDELQTNESDTEIGFNAPTLELPITVTASQRVSQ